MSSNSLVNTSTQLGASPTYNNAIYQQHLPPQVHQTTLVDNNHVVSSGGVVVSLPQTPEDPNNLMQIGIASSSNMAMDNRGGSNPQEVGESSPGNNNATTEIQSQEASSTESGEGGKNAKRNGHGELFTCSAVMYLESKERTCWCCF